MKSIFYKSLLAGLRTNLTSGPRTKKKLLIIESDDWGAIRTPSREVLEEFDRLGYNWEKSIYKWDALASETDLDRLFDLLSSIKNGNGKRPVITANVIVANPDFDKIRQANFQEFFYEPFYKTFQKYPEHKNNLSIWKKAIQDKLFMPQFHGREHLNISRWLRALNEPNSKARKCFDYNSTFSGFEDYAFMEAFDWSDPSEIENHKEAIIDGLRIFKETFGFESKSFIAPCYNWDSKIEPLLAEQGIKWIQGVSYQLAPTGVFDNYKPIRHTFAQKNSFGSRYNIRNVFFEPVNNYDFDYSLPALARIQAAFLLGRPAVISTHRINYVGFINPQNRDNGLRQLKKLLSQVVKKWPDVEFISTDQLSEYFE
jgi:hypothetical protein